MYMHARTCMFTMELPMKGHLSNEDTSVRSEINKFHPLKRGHLCKLDTFLDPPVVFSSSGGFQITDKKQMPK